MLSPLKVTGAVLLLGIITFPLLTIVEGDCEELSLDIVKEMRQIEFTQINYDQEAEPYFSYVKGTLPILISAPHGAKHYRTREKRWKKEDAYTSSMAIELGRLTGAHVLYVRNKAGEDPNNDVETAYKRFLRKVVKQNGIRFVLDLHGADSRRPFKVDVGIMEDETRLCSCPSYKEIIENVFQGFEAKVFNQDFRAGGKGTITGFARNKLLIESAQVEINAKYRIVESKSTGSRADPAKILDVVGRLRRAILDISQNILENSSAP